jgi:uncharacterized membrane protein
MTDALSLGPLGLPDLAALALTLSLWLGLGWLIENPPAWRVSVSKLMERYRHDWMAEFVTRQPRIFDATMIDSLRQGTAFFASASMIAIGGGIALIGNPAMLAALTRDLTLASDTAGLQLRVALVVAFLANALLKFIWAHRLFGYCSILMAAVPNDPSHPEAAHRATQAADINITGAKSFNRGLRSIYFALGALGWLLGPWGLVAGALVISAILIRRDFGSTSREVMLRKSS